MHEVTRLNDSYINGNAKDFAKYKQASENIARYLYRDESGSPTYNRLQSRTSQAIYNCANQLHYLKDSNGNLRMQHTYFCHSSLCPLCENGRYNRDSYRLYKVITETDRRSIALNLINPKYLFATLTMENVDTDGIKSAIEQLNYAWKKASNYKDIKPYIYGTIKRIEVVRAKDGTANVHIHMLMLVKPTFYNGKARLTHSQWSKLWSRALRQGYTADIKVSRLKTTQDAIQKARYMVKRNKDITDISSQSPDNVLRDIVEIDNGKYRKHLLTLTGVFKTVETMYQTRVRQPQKRNNNTDKHKEFTLMDEFDYSTAKPVTYTFDSLNGETDYYLIE